MFHVSRLRPFNKNNNKVFPKSEVQAYYDFGDAKDEEWLVDEILAHQWNKNSISFLVQWNLGDTTWEPYSECKDLAALDRYPELPGIPDNEWRKLPRKASTVKKSVDYSPPTNERKRRVG